MRLPALLLLAVLTLPMGQGALEALSSLTDLTIISGDFIFLDEVKDVAIKAKGKDQFQNNYTIRCRWKGGYPSSIYIYGPLEEL